MRISESQLRNVIRKLISEQVEPFPATQGQQMTVSKVGLPREDMDAAVAAAGLPEFVKEGGLDWGEVEDMFRDEINNAASYEGRYVLSMSALKRIAKQISREDPDVGLVPDTFLQIMLDRFMKSAVPVKLASGQDSKASGPRSPSAVPTGERATTFFVQGISPIPEDINAEVQAAGLPPTAPGGMAWDEVEDEFRKFYDGYRNFVGGYPVSVSALKLVLKNIMQNNWRAGNAIGKLPDEFYKIMYKRFKKYGIPAKR